MSLFSEHPVYTLNKIGPKTIPWGTPNFKGSSSENVPFMYDRINKIKAFPVFPRD